MAEVPTVVCRTAAHGISDAALLHGWRHLLVRRLVMVEDLTPGQIYRQGGPWPVGAALREGEGLLEPCRCSSSYVCFHGAALLGSSQVRSGSVRRGSIEN